jgi:UDP-hydrolysing UDP-N-acetyl-D-glucosamine 2-epimerase
MTDSISRKITVVTGTRADYGLLRLLITRLGQEPNIILETVVTGTHFLPEFGETWKQIEADGNPISFRVEILTKTDSPAEVARSTSRALAGFADVFEQSRPDLIVVLGDRYEALAAAEAAFLMGIPIAHIAGGEKTEGALDDSLRHAITKLSSLHFVASEEYAQRVIQLGENPDTVYNFGAIGLDNFEVVERMTIEELSEFVGFDLSSGPFFLCTVHPETATGATPEDLFEPLATALEDFLDYNILITLANADAGGRRMNELIGEFQRQNADRVAVIPSLGQRGYISALELSSVVIGNSSSGIVEAPTSGTPTVNIGERQGGRMRAPSIIDVGLDPHAISHAITRALSEDFQSVAAQKQSPFGFPGVSARIAEVLFTTDLSKLMPKSFCDLNNGAE